jgi:transcriptional regulator with XRE-family HTH domain
MQTANKISRHRKAAGLSQEVLGEKLGMTKFQVSRLENGETSLSVSTALRIAEVLGVPLADLIGQKDSERSGFAEDLVPYQPAPGDRLAGLAGDSVFLYTVATDAIDLAGFPRGMIVQVNESRRHLVKPLQAVHVLYHPPSAPDQAVRLLRLFVPPRLLITNSSVMNPPPLDTERDNATIMGVVEGGYRRFV